MSRKDFTQALARLKRQGLIVTVNCTGGGHLRVDLTCGAVYHAARSPSDYRAVQNMVSEIKRLTRAEAASYTHVSRLHTEGLNDEPHPRTMAAQGRRHDPQRRP